MIIEPAVCILDLDLIDIDYQAMGQHLIWELFEWC